MEKLDLLKKHKTYYTATAKPVLIDVEEAHFLSVVGKGDPSSAIFSEKVQALYASAYAMKFSCKAAGKDFVVPKLEGLWWFDESQYSGLSMSEAPKKVPRDAWHWRLLIRMPDYVNANAIHAIVENLVAKKKLPPAPGVELYTLKEGRCVQMLHVGAFDKEPETLEQIREFMQANKLTRTGPHHEIYLSDFTKTAPDKLKTILREPC